VQHIQNFQRFWNSKDWVYTFTQEWPVDLGVRNVGNPCNAIQPVWRPCRSAHPR
jgi:hypothetical protein